jgi:MFS family permease
VFYGLFAFVFGLVDPFLVLYIKYQLRYPDTAVNLVRLWWQIGGLLGLWLIGRFLDTVGPRIVYLWTTAVITGGMFLFVIPYAGMPYSVGLLGLIFAVKGFADFGFNLANTDSLLLVASPRNPALSIVVASAVNLTTSSIAQLISGHLLTRYAGWQPRWPIDFNIYKAMFLAAGVLFLLLVGLRFLVPAAIRKETRA